MNTVGVQKERSLAGWVGFCRDTMIGGNPGLVQEAMSIVAGLVASVLDEPVGHSNIEKFRSEIHVARPLTSKLKR
jgi:hypothetical protein